MRIYRGVALALLGLVALGACKSTKVSGTKDAVTDALFKTIPGGLVKTIVAKKKVTALIIPPADGSNGAPDSMNGVWWTNAHSVHFVVSLKNAVWTPMTGTATNPSIGVASIPFTGAGTYSVGVGSDPTFDQFSQQPIDRSFMGYDIVYSSPTHSNLMSASSDSNGNRHSHDYGYTMDYTDDGEWTRHTRNQPDYHLRRIINADGTINQKLYDMKIPNPDPDLQSDPRNDIDMHDTAFNGFLADPRIGGGPDGAIGVYSPSNVIQAADGQSLDVIIDPDGPVEYISIVGGDPRLRGSVTVAAGADNPVKLLVQPTRGELLAGDSRTAPVVSGLLGDKAAIALQPVNPSLPGNGVVHVTLNVAPIYQLSDDAAQPMTVHINPGQALDFTVAAKAIPAGLYRVRTTAAFPLTLSATGVNYFSIFGTPPTAVTMASNVFMNIAFDYTAQAPMQISLPAGSPGGDFTISLEPYSTTGATTRDMGVLTVNGRTVSATLTAIDEVDLYRVPQNTTMPPLYITMKVSPNFGQSSNFYISGIDGSSSIPPLTQLFGGHIRRFSSSGWLNLGRLTNPMIAIYYVGDLNVANPPTLTYSFSFTENGNDINDITPQFETQ